MNRKQLFEEESRLNPKFARAYNNRGIAFSINCEYERALSDYNEAIRLNPKNDSAYNNRAMLLAACADAKHRNGRKAVKDALRACELTDWKKPEALDTLAASFAETGDFENAIKWESRAIEIAPTDTELRAYRVRLELYYSGTPYRDEVRSALVN